MDSSDAGRRDRSPGPCSRCGCRLTWLLSLWVVCAILLPSTNAQVNHGRFQFGQAVYTTSADFGVAQVTVQRHLGFDGRAAVYVSAMTSGGGNAVVGRDYRALFNQSLVWQDGDDFDQQLSVHVHNDGVPQEINKTLTLYLHDANGAELNAERDRTQIVLVPPTNLVSGSFRLLTSAMTTVESSSTVFEVPVIWDGGTTSSARLAYETRCESACNPDDFEVVSPPVLAWVRGGNAMQLIRIKIKDDGRFEPSETFRIVLLPPSDLDPPPPDPVNDPSSAFTLPPATLGNITQVVVTILGPNNVNSGAVQFEAPCFPACPGTQYLAMNGGIVRAYLQRRNGSDCTVQARVVALDGTARAGIDFKPVNQIVTWNDGDSSTQFVVVEIISGVVRTATAQFTLTLVDIHTTFGGVPLSSLLASSAAGTATVTIQGPSNIVPNEVNFIQPNALASVLRFPDDSFLPMVTRLDSDLRKCPRVVIRKAGDLTLFLRRSFGSIIRQAASVVVNTLDDSAVDGVDYVGLPAEGRTITWTEKDMQSTIKTLIISIPQPTRYYTERRSFYVAIASVSGVALGLCHTIEVILDRVSRPPRVAAFDLDMNAGALTVRTTIAVLASTLDASAFQLQSDAVTPLVANPSSSFESLRLSSQSTTTSVDGTTIVLMLGLGDLYSLKRFRRLAKAGTTTYLSAKQRALDYVLDNCLARGFEACAHAPLEGIPAANALAVSTFTPDTTRPVLLGFTLDLGLGLVKLRFSEPVDSSRVRLESLGFSDTPDAVNLRYLSSPSLQVFRPNPNTFSSVLLNDGNPLPADATYLTIQIGSTDLTAIRAVGGGQLGLQPASTFLTIDADFVHDFALSPNKVVAIPPPTLAMPALRLLSVAAVDCSPCASGTFLAHSCSAMQSRVCRVCTVCPTNSYALQACTSVADTVCYPCTECIGGRFTQSPCSPTSDRVCVSCTQCSSDEYEASPCVDQRDRVCRTCDSCALSDDQKRLCRTSKRWRRRQMKSPYGCPVADQTYQTLEARLQRSKSNRCGAGRCSCTGNIPGNANPNGESFPDDPRCTGPQVFGVDL